MLNVFITNFVPHITERVNGSWFDIYDSKAAIYSKYQGSNLSNELLFDNGIITLWKHEFNYESRGRPIQRIAYSFVVVLLVVLTFVLLFCSLIHIGQ